MEKFDIRKAKFITINITDEEGKRWEFTPVDQGCELRNFAWNYKAIDYNIVGPFSEPKEHFPIGGIVPKE